MAQIQCQTYTNATIKLWGPEENIYLLFIFQGRSPSFLYFRRSLRWAWRFLVGYDVVHSATYITGCNRRNGPHFGRVFLRSNYTDITQNTYIQSWTVTEILPREKSGLLWCLRTVLVSVTSFSPLLELHSYVTANVAPATYATGETLAAYSGWKSMDNYDTCASVFVVLFNGFMSLTSYFDVMYRY